MPNQMSNTQDDDLAAVTIVTGTITHGEERCYECGGTIPEGADTVVTTGVNRVIGFVTVRFRCTSCHLDQD